MKQTMKNVAIVGAIVLVSAGVGGASAYKLLSKEREASASFS